MTKSKSPKVAMNDLTWSCHICGLQRPDHLISVMTHRRSYEGVEFDENVRYCNDNLPCIKSAKTFTLLKGDGDDEVEFYET